MDAHPAINRIDTLYHLYGTKDAWQRLGQCIFPARWPVAPWSRWNRAVASGKITVICIGPMVHEGRHSYMDDSVVLDSGRPALFEAGNAAELFPVEGLTLGALGSAGALAATQGERRLFLGALTPR